MPEITGINIKQLSMTKTEQLGGKDLQKVSEKSNYADGLTQTEASEIDEKYGNNDGVLTYEEYKNARETTDKAADNKITDSWMQCLSDFGKKKMTPTNTEITTATQEINSAWNLLPDYLKSLGLDKLDTGIFSNLCSTLNQYIRVEGHEIKTNDISKLVKNFLASQDQSKVASSDASTITNVLKKMAGKYGKNDKLSASDFYSPVLAYAIVKKGGNGTTSNMNKIMDVLNNNVWGASTNNETLINELQKKLSSMGINNIKNSELMAMLNVAGQYTNMQTSDVNTSKSIKKTEDNHNAVSTSKNGASELIKNSWSKFGDYIAAKGCKNLSNDQIMPELITSLKSYLSQGNEILLKDMNKIVKENFKSYLSNKGIELTDADADKIIESLKTCAKVYGSKDSLSMSDFYSVTMAYTIASKNCNDTALISKNTDKLINIINNNMWGSNISKEQLITDIYSSLTGDLKSSWSKDEVKELVNFVYDSTMGDKDVEKNTQKKTAEKQIDNTWELRAGWINKISGTNIRTEVMDGLMECLDSYLKNNEIFTNKLDSLVNGAFKDWLANKGIVLTDDEANGIITALKECAKYYGNDKTLSMTDFYSGTFAYALASKGGTDGKTNVNNMYLIMNLINNNLWGSDTSKEDFKDNIYNKLPADVKSAWSEDEFSTFVNLVYDRTMGDKDITAKVEKNANKKLINNSWNLRKEWLNKNGTKLVREDVMNGLMECLDEYLKNENIDVNKLNKLITVDFASWLKKNKDIDLSGYESKQIISTLTKCAGTYGKDDTFSLTDFYSPVLAHTLLSKSDSSKMTTENMQTIMDALNNRIWGSNNSKEDIVGMIKDELANLGIKDWSDSEIKSLVDIIYDGTMIGEHEYDAVTTLDTVNGEIDEWVKQGYTGDCWLVSGVLSLNETEKGKEIIKNSIKVEKNGDVTVTFKGVGKSYTISAKEIMQHDTDNNLFDAYSSGDNDMLVLELAMEKLFAEIRSSDDENLKQLIPAINNPGIEGQTHQTLIYFMTGQNVDEVCNGRNNILNLETFNSSLDKVANSDNVAAGFSLFGASSLTHKATCTDGTEFSFSFLNEAEGHGFTIVDVTEDEVTFVNPHDSTKEYTMTREEFQKIGIGHIYTVDLDAEEQIEEDTEFADVT